MWKEVQQTRKKEVLFSHFVESSRPSLTTVRLEVLKGNSDHFSLSALISMGQKVLNLCVSRKVFLKHQVNWNTVCGAIQDLPWHNIWHADNPVEVLNKHMSQLVGRC